MKTRVMSAAVSAVWALLQMSSSVSAASLVVPPGLHSGDQYRVVFVTSSGHDGTSTAITDYDFFVGAAANATGSLFLSLGTTWQAIASTASVDAYSHIGGNFLVPVYGVDGLLVATSASDMWDGSLSGSIYLDQFGHNQSGVIISSGTTDTGARSVGPLGAAAITSGAAGYITPTWIEGGIEGNTAVRQIYGISGNLTVDAVPEPETLALILIGLMAVAVRAKGRLRAR